MIKISTASPVYGAPSAQGTCGDKLAGEMGELYEGGKTKVRDKSARRIFHCRLYDLTAFSTS
jgi:hypothetical protein